MSQPTERREFQAEVKQLLDLMVHSLYSNKDIALRELVSNASDALDKLRYAQLTQPELTADGELHIRLTPNAAERTLTIADNGIGMSRDEVIKNVGTIAKSGTKEFMAALKSAKNKASAPDLIGQFGVGFYSAFMVASKVVLVTRRAGESTATRWESSGDGAYTLSEDRRPSAGTSLTLFLKPADEEQGLQDLTEPYVIKSIIKRYSDFVAYPIRMLAPAAPPAETEDAAATAADGATANDAKNAKNAPDSQAKDADKAAAAPQDEVLNSRKAIWDRPKSEVTEQEYNEFYRHVSHDWTDPQRTLPIRMEGNVEAYALLYIPAKAPFDLYSQEMKRGVQLYVRRVFVMDECKELMPAHLRFIKGVVDAHDLTLNVSREILQKDRQIQLIRKQLVKKVLAALQEMQRDKAEDYLSFWNNFGPALKEGLLTYEVQDQDKLLELVMANSTADDHKLTALADYVGRMKPDQKAIYFLTGSSKEAVQKSPLLEAFVAKGYEVLLFSDPVDEIWLERAPKFKDKTLQSIGRGEVELGSEAERKQASEALDKKKQEMGGLLESLQKALGEDVKEVRLSNRLTASAACLVADSNGMSPRLQKMMEQMGQKPPKVQPILELNPKHALIDKLQTIAKETPEDSRLALYAKLLLGQAHLLESAQVPDPAAFTKVLADVMLRAV